MSDRNVDLSKVLGRLAQRIAELELQLAVRDEIIAELEAQTPEDKLEP